MALQFISILASTVDSSVSSELAQDASQFARLTDSLGVNLPSITAQIINFCVVASVLYFFAFKPVLASLATRQKKIADGLQYAEDMKLKLADAEHQYAETMKQAARESQSLLEKARNDAKAFMDQQTQEAVHHAEEIIKKANEATQFERAKMFTELRKEVSQLVVTTTAKVLGHDLPESERKLFNDKATQALASKN